MTSHSKEPQNLDVLPDEVYAERVNEDLLTMLPFQVQQIDDGRFMIILGFASIIPKDHTEEDALAAMKRTVVDMLKFADVIQKKDEDGK